MMSSDMDAPVYTDDTVRSCDSCPFSMLRYEGHGSKPFWCCHPKWGGAEGHKVSIADNPFNGIPSWCPLREGPVLVRLTVDVTGQGAT